MAEGPSASRDVGLTTGFSPTEWSRISDLFYAAREKPAEERSAFLDTACGPDTPLRKAVEELLRQDEDAEGFLSRPVFGSVDSDVPGTCIVEGQHFGRYVIGTLLGRGGMGEVWSAHDTDLDRPVALKFLSPRALAILDAQQIIREAKAASALNHPNIVTIHEIVRSESTLAIVMELVEGAPLRQAIGKLSLTEVLEVGCQIAEGLAAAHGGGIVHGDIKPENILLRRDRYVKLLDFGLARKISAETIPTTDSPALGTLRYLSPEQARGEPATPASDIFSFGLVLYELATGQHPFPAASAIETAHAIRTMEPPTPSSANPRIPARLNSLIRAMLGRAGRPSAEQVVRSLQELQKSKKAYLGSVSPIWKRTIAAILIAAGCYVAWLWKQAKNASNVPVFRQITTLVPENRATAAAISADGKLAAYANVDGLFIREMDTGKVRQITAPGDFTVDRIAWFRDNSRLVVSGFSNATRVSSIWITSLAGGAPRLLRTHAREASPSTDGTHIAFISEDWSEIWVMNTRGDEPRRLVAGRFGEDKFPVLFWSPDDRRLSFERRRLSPGHSGQYATLDPDHVWTTESVQFSTGRNVSKMPGELMNSAAALADGRILFLRWDANFLSAHEIWEIQTAPRTGRFLGAARKGATLLTTNDETLVGLSATTNGKRIMVLRKSDQNTVFVGDFDPVAPRISNIRRLTLDERTNYAHAWTADSRAVIFESNRNGSFDLFKQSINQHTPEVIVATPATEMLPQLAPDGRTVLYAIRSDSAKPEVYKLMRIPVEGGNPEPVPIGGSLDEFRCALETGKRCVLRTTARGKYYAYYDLDPLKGKGKELARTNWHPGILGDWDISPDGSAVAIPNHDSRSASIRIVLLDPKPNEPREREVVLEGVTDLRGLVWAADGKAWFVSVDTSVGHQLLYVYLDGRFRSLGDIQGWAVPSPDGRRVAFQDRIVTTNAWLIEQP